MRLPKTTKSRVWLGVGALTVFAVIAFGITAHNLWQDGNAPSASKAKDGKGAIPDGPTGYPTFAGPTPSAGASSGVAANSLLSNGLKGADPFKGGNGDTSFHKVTVTFRSDGAIYTGYQYRNGQGAAKVISKQYSVTKSVRGPLPIVYVVVQVLSTATYATCTISIDGVVANTETAHGKYQVVGCLS